jgi:hypothetical protein
MGLGGICGIGEPLESLEATDIHTMAPGFLEA